MGRSILAVLGGLVCMLVLVMIATFVTTAIMLSPTSGGGILDPTAPYLVVNLTYSLLAAVLGGYVSGRLAAHRPLIHAAVLATVLTVLSGMSARGGSESADVQPEWYPGVIAIIGVVGVLAGGWWRRQQLLDPIVA